MTFDPFQYKAPTEEQTETIKRFRAACRELSEQIRAEIPVCRARSLTLTKLEEVSMWGNKAIVFGEESNA